MRSRHDLSVEYPIPVPPESNPYALVHWDAEDPLRDILLATFGGYPPAAEIGIDYEGFTRDNLNPSHYWAKKGEALPTYLLEKTTPSEVSGFELNWDRIPHATTLGFYAGSVGDFEDLVNYWNLRAAGLNILFLDPKYSDRMALLRQAHLEFIEQRRKSSRHSEIVAAAAH